MGPNGALSGALSQHRTSHATSSLRDSGPQDEQRHCGKLPRYQTRPSGPRDRTW